MGAVSTGDDEDAVVSAAAAGDESAFATLVERYRPGLQVHCYRMLGSLDESEDLVQETFLRAWRKRDSYRGHATFGAWLYRIATNACLDHLRRHRRRRLPPEVASPPELGAPPPAAIPWVQPYPDHLLEPLEDPARGPDAAVVAKETIELAFIAAIQLLPPQRRAVLILRDVLGWSAKETAEALESSVAAVNSALQRARPMLRGRLPRHRLDWTPSPAPTEAELAILELYMDAIERADDTALAAILHADARVSHHAGAGGHLAPEPTWYRGREAIIAAWAPILHGPDTPELRLVSTRANRGPAVATYIRTPGMAQYQAFALTVLRIDDDTVAEVAVFAADLFPAFNLPETA